VEHLDGVANVAELDVIAIAEIIVPLSIRGSDLNDLGPIDGQVFALVLDPIQEIVHHFDHHIVRRWLPGLRNEGLACLHANGGSDGGPADVLVLPRCVCLVGAEQDRAWSICGWLQGGGSRGSWYNALGDRCRQDHVETFRAALDQVLRGDWLQGVRLLRVQHVALLDCCKRVDENQEELLVFFWAGGTVSVVPVPASSEGGFE
jgi:hypothetical protein